MSIPVVAFFNNKGGVGKTTLVYHIAWMFADQGLRVIAGDFDPQANLTSAFLDEERLEQIFDDKKHELTIFGCLQPLKKGIGDIASPHIEAVSDRLGVIPGDMALSTFEDQFSEVWPKCLDGDERAFRVTSAFWRIAQRAAKKHGAQVILIDLGPNLGAINRTALIASDFVVVPLGPDLFSIMGLQNLGPTLRRWRKEWKERVPKNPAPNDIPLPQGTIHPLGYVVLRHSIRLDRPVKAYDKWIDRIPDVYKEDVLGERLPAPSVDEDKHCLAKLRDYRSLMPLAQEARKPMFFLKPADGALGAHQAAVKAAYDDFLGVARRIASGAGIPIGD